MKEENTQANCGLLFEANLSYTYLYAVRYPFYVVSLINILKASVLCIHSSVSSSDEQTSQSLHCTSTVA